MNSSDYSDTSELLIADASSTQYMVAFNVGSNSSIPSTNVSSNLGIFRGAKVIKLIPKVACNINSNKKLEGQQNSVYDIQLVSDKLYIADYRNNKIIEFNPESGAQRIIIDDVFHPHGLFVTKDKIYVATHVQGQRIESYSREGKKASHVQNLGMSAVSISSAWNRLFFVDDGSKPGLYELLEEKTKYFGMSNSFVGTLRPHCVRFHGKWDRLIVANRGFPAIFVYPSTLEYPQIFPLPGMDPLCAVPIGDYLFVINYVDNRIYIFDRQFEVRLVVEFTNIKSKITNLTSDDLTLYFSEQDGNRIFSVLRKSIFDQLAHRPSSR